MANNDEMPTDDRKLKQLATWSSRYRAGIKEMVEGGWDPEELDTAVEVAEGELEAERKEKQKALKRRKLVKNF